MIKRRNGGTNEAQQGGDRVAELERAGGSVLSPAFHALRAR